MQTIHDINREFGNPRHGEVDGTPRSIHRFFGPTAPWKFGALFLFILAIIFIAIGVFALVFPISIIGFVILALSGIVYARAKFPPVP